MRKGLPLGALASSAIHLPMWNGSTLDRGPDANTVTSTQTGAGPAVTYADGPFGDALQFGVTGTTNYPRLEVTPSTTWSGAFRILCWARSQDPTNVRSLITRRPVGGSFSYVFAARVSGNDFSWTVWNSVGSNTTCTPEVTFMPAGMARWCFWEFGFVPSTCLYVKRDDQLWGYKATTLANVRSTVLGPIQIGSEVSDAVSSQWTGQIAGVRIDTTSDIAATWGPNIGPDRATRRGFVAVDIDLKENLEADTWTDDTTGGFYRAKSGIDLGSFIVGAEDVVSVKSTTGTTTTTYAEVGNVTDLDAASNSYFYDAINSRLYSSENPASADVFMVAIRARFGTRTLRRGFRTYIPVLGEASAPERRMSAWNQPFDQGRQGSLSIAAQHADLPTGIASEEATAIAWKGAEFRMALMSDRLPWVQRIVLAKGIVDAQPEDQRDTLGATTFHEIGKFYRIPAGDKIADKATWPYIREEDDGYQWPSIFGRGHPRVRAVCVDTRPTTVGGVGPVYRRKICDHKIAAITRCGYGVTVGLPMYSIDLSVAELYTAAGPTYEVWVDVAGYGTASTSTSTPGTPYYTFGTESETDTTPVLVGQGLMTLYGGVAAVAYGSTWAATGARVLLERRWAETGDFLGFLQRHLSEEICHTYYVPSTELWEFEDVVKSDALEWTLRDEDLLDESWRDDRSQLATRANIVAYVYTATSSGEVKKGSGTTLALKADPKYGVKATWTPLGGALGGMYTKADADLFIPKVQRFMEAPTWFHSVTVGSRFASIEQFAVVSDQTSRRPSAAGSRFRVMSVQPNPVQGTVSLEMVSETNYPGDAGSSTGSTSDPPVRDPFLPYSVIDYGDSAGTALATTGAWTPVGTHETISGVLTGQAFASAMTHRFQVYAQRTGGAADADFQLRIRDITNGVTIASIAGVSTTAGFATASTSFTLPTGRCRVRLEYLLAAGVAGTLFTASWMARENTGVLLSDKVGPLTIWETGVRTGASCVVATAWTRVPSFGAGQLAPVFVPADLSKRAVVYADGAGTTGFQLALMEIPTGTSPGSFVATVAPFGTITTAGFYEMPSVTARWGYPWWLVYKCASGTGVVYSAAVHIRFRGY